MIPVPASVLEALALLFGVRATDLSRFAGGREDSDGVIYAFPYQGTRRLLKIMAIPAVDQNGGLFCLDERLRFMRFLGDQGAPVVFPQQSPQGNLYETHGEGSYLWVGYNMDIAPGASLPFGYWDEALFHRWGQTVGLMHRLAQQYPSWEASTNPADGKAHLNWAGEWQGFYDWCQDDEIKQKWGAIGESLKALPRDRTSFGFIHNDPHIANLLVNDDQITILDFDVANHHWFLFSHSGGMDRPLQDRQKLLDFLHHFLQGYASENKLGPFWFEQLDLFIAYRRILLFIVMYGWIQSKPKVHTAWKQMILTQPEII
jgi:Ser/Thr protein kinase RdoA (MazF antagonist)